MKRLLFLALSVLMCHFALAQNCTTIDFELPLESTLGEYQVYTGKTNGIISNCSSSIPDSLNPTTLNESNGNAPNSNHKLTIVTLGPDEQVQTLAGTLQNGDPISLNRTFQGQRALRINQNKGSGNPNIWDENEVDIFVKQFILEAPEVSLMYACAFEFEVGVPAHRQAYFSATLRCLDHNIQIDNDCFEANITDPSLGVINNTSIYPADNTLVVKGWDLMTLSATGHLGHNVELRLESGDCNGHWHGGYTYVDDITYCGEEINIIPCEDVCDVTPIINKLVNLSDPCNKTFTASNVLNCENLSYNWLIDGVAYNNQTSVTVDFTNSGPHDICVTIVDANGNTCTGPNSTVCIQRIYPECEDTSECEDCGTVAQNILDSLTAYQDVEFSNCIGLGVDIPLLSDCHTGVIIWDDPNTQPVTLTSDSTIGNIYLTPGEKTIRVKLYDENGDLCADLSETKVVTCEEECVDPCDLPIEDIEINVTHPSTRDDCNYTFDVDLDIDDCFDGYFTYSWQIYNSNGIIVGDFDGFTTSTISSFAYDFSNNVNDSYTVKLRIVYYDETQSSRLCQFYLSKKIDINCGQVCGDPCDLDVSLDIDTNGCEYIFTPNIAFPCLGVTYKYAWNIQSQGPFPLSYEDSLIFEFNQSNQEVIQLTIIATKPNGKTCPKQVFQFPINVICNTVKREILISPNPSKKQQELSFEGINYRELSTIKIVDIYGNTKSIIKPNSNGFNIRDLNPGIYFIRFNTKDETIIKKLIIQ